MTQPIGRVHNPFTEFPPNALWDCQRHQRYRILNDLSIPGVSRELAGWI